jgi:hypothetical protein
LTSPLDNAEISAGLHAFLTDGAADSFAEEPVVDRALYVKRMTRDANGEPRPRFVQQGGVRFHRATTYRLTADDLEPMAQRRDAYRRLRLELVKFAFTFRDLPAGRWYTTIRVRITLIPQPPLLYLHPRLITAESQSTRSFSSEFNPGLVKLVQLELKRTSADSTTRTEQQPIVTALDDGPEGFGWKYEARDGAPLFPRNEESIVVLELPPDTKTVVGAFDAEAVVSHKRLGRPVHSDALPSDAPAPILLDLVTGN